MDAINNNIHILVADDEESIRSIVAEVLMDEGYKVTTAKNGQEALSIASDEKHENGPVHVLVTDIRMPEMTGIELLEKIKEYDEKIEVVIMTSHASTETAIQAIRLGAYDYLTKPFEDLNVIPTVIKRTVKKLQLELEVEQLLGELKERNTAIQTLYEETRKLFGTLKLEEIYAVATKSAVQISDADEAVFYVPDKKRTSLTTKNCFPSAAMKGKANTVIEVADVDIDWSNSESVNSNCQLKQKLFEGSEDSHILLWPIFADEELAGCVGLRSDEHQMNDETQDLLPQYLDNVGVQIEKAKMHSQIATMAIRDGLTGLYNRRYFEQTLEKEIMRAKRFGSDLSLLLFDIDHFKHYNDTNGHLMGDQILKNMADILIDGGRAIDIAARYGGEEFVVILVGANKKGAAVRGDKLREEIAKFDFEHGNKQPLGAVTVSGGYAQYGIDGKNAAELIEAADKALYKAKENGRDSILPAGK